MVHLTDGNSFRNFRVLLFHHTVIFLLLIQPSAGQPTVVNATQPIEATVGDDTILTCHLEPAMDAVSMTLEWSRPDLEHKFVHVWHEGKDVLADQNLSYKGRTSLSVEKSFISLVVGPSSAPVADDGGGGHSEEDEERERDDGESGGRVELANPRMVHLTYGRFFRVLLFHQSVIFLLLIQSSEGQSQLSGPTQPVAGGLGNDVIWSRYLTPPVITLPMTVEWPELNNIFLRIMRFGEDLLVDQNHQRTSAYNGDISLKLSKVELSDEGKYRVQQKNITQTRETHIHLPAVKGIQTGLHLHWIIILGVVSLCIYKCCLQNN